VQGRVAHRRAADEHRLQLGDRGQLAGAADLDLDAEQLRHLLLRRVLVRHRPARLAADEAEPLLQRAIVDLVDHAVDVERQRVALLADAAMERDQAVGACDDGALLVDRQPHRGERIDERAVGRRNSPAAHLTDAVGEELQRPLRRDRRVVLAHRAGGGIARVDEGLLVLRALGDQLALALVQRIEVVAPDVDLATHLEHRRRRAAQAQRDLLDRSDVLRDVLAGLAVAARRGLHEHAIFVAQVDCEAVELQLGGVFDRRIALCQRQLAPHPRVERHRAARLGVGLGADRQHRHRVAHRHEAVEHAADDPLGGRVGGQQLGVRRLDRLQLLEQAVVFGVGDRRVVEHVVAVGMLLQQLAQRGGAQRRRIVGIGGRTGRRHPPIVRSSGAASLPIANSITSSSPSNTTAWRSNRIPMRSSSRIESWLSGEVIATMRRSASTVRPYSSAAAAASTP
jgi:hypothetical protein